MAKYRVSSSFAISGLLGAVPRFISCLIAIFLSLGAYL
jgi:hypothetical protein